MSKKRNTPKDHIKPTELWQLNGFWKLRSITQTAYLNQKNAGRTLNRFQTPVCVLIECHHMQLIWHVGTEKAFAVPIQIYRGKVITRPLLEITEVRADCQLRGKLMFWRFVINRDSNHYAQFVYEFLKDE
ncbi:MAG: hypothetical protein U1O81_07905 [Planktothrix rubescens PR223]|jgi:membrane-bound acyltransferase YfiQ involved in biofilm formation